jgi:hypothetical protein
MRLLAFQKYVFLENLKGRKGIKLMPKKKVRKNTLFEKSRSFTLFFVKITPDLCHGFG